MKWKGAALTRWALLAALAMSGLRLYATDPQYVIASVAGSNLVGDGGQPASARLGAAEGVAVDAAGNVYIADNIDNRVRKVSSSTGLISTVAGDGHTGFAGDGAPANQALLDKPYGLAVDVLGNLYIADFGNGRVRKVSPDGTIRTLVGGGVPGDGLGARLAGPRNVAVDTAGNLYISDFSDHRVYRVTPDGQISSAAGTGVAGYNGDGVAASARLNAPAGLAVDHQGTLYIADSGNNRIRTVAGGLISTLLGGDEGGLARPTGLAVDGTGNLYIADSGNSRILKRDPAGRITVLASGALARDVALDSYGNIYAAAGRWVLKVNSAGTVAPFAGDGTYGLPGDGLPATMAWLGAPIGVAVDGSGNLYIADEAQFRVRKVDSQGTVSTVAGDGSQQFGGDGGLATAASLIDPVAVAADGQGGFLISDYLGNRVRGVSSDGLITTVTGNGQEGFDEDNMLAQAAQVNRPRGVALDRYGDIYIADSGNHRIRRIFPSGMMGTVAGSGVRGYSGDGGPAALAQLDSPAGVAADSEDNLYIADYANHAIRKVSPDGTITSVAGTGTRGFSGDNGPAKLADLNFPTAVAVDEAGNLYIADSSNHRIRKVTSDGVIRTIAGDGTPGFSGDGGPATQARLRFPTGVAVDRGGNVYVADLDNKRVRKLTPSSAPVVAEVLDECSVVHGASLLSGPVAPGQIISVLCAGIAPAEDLADTEARFDGEKAPLFYVGPDQINAQVPYRLAGTSSTEVEIYHKGKLRCRARLAIAPSAPGIFTVGKGAGQAVAVNEDGVLNSADHPAARGSVITLYATGEGQTDPAGVDGKPATSPFPKPLLPVSLRVAGLPVEILFAGSAPGFAGLLQINARLPGAFSPSGTLAVVLRVGSASSQPGVTIEVR
jgi:uncharacterized protein (TIGR03437 family)